MPYRTYTSVGANAAARAEEMRAELDAALTDNSHYTKVTSGYTGNSTWNYMDVWKNDGLASGGYEWYVIVARHSTSSYTLLGAALEYDTGTTTAKKALRSGNGFVNSDGYPVTTSGGSTEVTFPLSTFAQTTSDTAGCLGGSPTAPTTAFTAGHILATLVTNEMVWQAYGAAGPPPNILWSHGVGVYEQMHSTTQDLKPLGAVGFKANSTAEIAGTVWRSPTGSATYNYTVVHYNPTDRFTASVVNACSGTVGGTNVDLLYGGPVGSRAGQYRVSGLGKRSSTAGGIDTKGNFLGLQPKDFLIFDRESTVLVRDTITVNGKVYACYDSSSGNPGLFVNTEPDS